MTGNFLVTDLMWIEKKLTERNLSRQTRSELEAMRAAALNGTLRESDLETWKRKGGREVDSVRLFLSGARALRRRAAQNEKIPAEAIAHIDAAIQIVSAIK